MLLIDSVYQFWHKEKRRPTVAETAELTGLSPDTFYRRYTKPEFYKAVRAVCGRVELVYPIQRILMQFKERTERQRSPALEAVAAIPLQTISPSVRISFNAHLLLLLCCPMTLLRLADLKSRPDQNLC
jgi:hypothetical protein